MRVCSIPGCPTIHDLPGSRCDTHETQARSARVDNKVYNSRGHRAFRLAVLATEPICRECGIRQATVADHWPLTRRELIDAGLNPNDPAAGRALCAGCHNKHTAATSPGGWANRD